jgi:hypothetical protein
MSTNHPDHRDPRQRTDKHIKGLEGNLYIYRLNNYGDDAAYEIAYDCVGGGWKDHGSSNPADVNVTRNTSLDVFVVRLTRPVGSENLELGRFIDPYYNRIICLIIKFTIKYGLARLTA